MTDARNNSSKSWKNKIFLNPKCYCVLQCHFFSRFCYFCHWEFTHNGGEEHFVCSTWSITTCKNNSFHTSHCQHNHFLHYFPENKWNHSLRGLWSNTFVDLCGIWAAKVQTTFPPSTAQVWIKAAKPRNTACKRLWHC